MAKQPKGVRYGGRQKGTKNVLTLLRESRVAELEAKLQSLNWDLIEYIHTQLQEIDDPRDRAYLAAAILPYRYPKLKQIELKNQNPFEGKSPDELLEIAKNMVRFLETGEIPEEKKS